MNALTIIIISFIIASIGCISNEQEIKVEFSDLFPTENLARGLFLLPLQPPILIKEEGNFDGIEFIKYGSATYRRKSEIGAKSSDELTVDIQLDIILLENQLDAGKLVEKLKETSQYESFDGYISISDITVAEGTVSYDTVDFYGNPMIYI